MTKFAYAFALLCGLFSFATHAESDISNHLSNDEEYSFTASELYYTTLDRSLSVRDLPSLDQFHQGRHCTPNAHEKCWFALKIKNTSSKTPFLRQYNGPAQTYTMYYKGSEGDHYIEESHVNAKIVKLPDFFVKNNGILVFEYADSKDIIFPISAMSLSVVTDKIINGSIGDYIYWILGGVVIVFYAGLKGKSSFLPVSLLMLYLLTTFYCNSYYFLSIVDDRFFGEISLNKYHTLEIQPFVYLLAYVFLFEISFYFFDVPLRYLITTRITFLIGFILLFILTLVGNYINAMTNINFMVYAGLVFYFIYSLKAYRWFYSLLIMTCITLLFVTYLGFTNSKIFGFGYDFWAVFFQLSCLIPVLMFIQDLFNSKVLSLTNYNKIVNESMMDYMTNVRNVRALSKEVKEVDSEYFYHLECSNLRNINATLGRGAGDRALINFSKYLESVVRSKDNNLVVYRVSGDEFVILSDCIIPCSLVTNFEFLEDKHSQQLSFYCGSAMRDKNNNEDATITLRKAEHACYFAKSKDINCSKFKNEDLISLYSLPSNKSSAKELFNKNNIVCYAQEIKTTRPNAPNKIELLCRLMDFDQVLHPAYRILNIAKVHSLELELDLVMLEHASDALKSLPSELIVSINVVPNSLFSEEMQSRLAMLCEKYPRRLTLEITEHTFYQGSPKFFEIIEKLKDIGVIISLDDFGSGYSSYGILSSGYFDELKIDGELIKKVNTDLFTRKLVKSIYQLCDSAGIKVVAEYVEDSDILETVEDIQIDYFQGYYIHKPEPISKYIERACSS